MAGIPPSPAGPAAATVAAPSRDAGSRQRPLVSIVTVVRNAAGSLERTMESVLAQTYEPVEYIVVDGASTDGTVDVIRRHADRLGYWVSEPDRGISDAFNKGLARATGSFVGFLNADDWMRPDQIERAVATLEDTAAAFVFGDLTCHAPDGRVLYRLRGDPAYADALGRGMPNVNHQTMVARRRLFEVAGGFDLSYRYAMDYDWLLRVHRAGFRGIYDPGIQGRVSLGGAADHHWRRALAEVRRIAIANGVPGAAAWWWYLYRASKGGVRRALERLVPVGLHDGLRRVINPHYRRRS